jgi:hypothetical protein
MKFGISFGSHQASAISSTEMFVKKTSWVIATINDATTKFALYEISETYASYVEVILQCLKDAAWLIREILLLFGFVAVAGE